MSYDLTRHTTTGEETMPHVIKTNDGRYVRIDHEGISLTDCLAKATLDPDVAGYIIGQPYKKIEVVVMEAEEAA